ncbi:hypothetical protein [Maribacter sp. HTCC2170]|uniref:hypothetical protein n=1 Tax=Maribacter sp. (strain HTCC2170 / KCCM 42371) TaxID=313603 RepID=UPI00006AFCFC|nr:hypothetical protein [Maribacter sp. HTCC2170]EAR01409.1 hypothetical protein FB2170_11831 [Maribacter sp. HTCC2170]
MDKLKKIIDKGFTENYLFEDIDDVRKSLSDYGVNLDDNSERQDKLIKQLKFKLRSSINKEKNENLLLKATESFQEAINKGLEKPIAYLNNLIKENQLVVQYNKLDKLGPDEIKEIIKDQNLIEIIELLENEQ